MPVTPAHAAVAVPFARVLPALALVVGTQVPDLPMIFPAVTPSYAITHDYLRGLPIDTAYGLGLWGLCVWIAPAALALLPAQVRRKLTLPARFSSRTIVALALGSLSHLLWDEFTHEGRFGARHFAWLRAPWSFDIPGYKWLQYGTGLLALVFLALWTLWKLNALPLGDEVPKLWPAKERHAIRVTLLVLLPVAALARASLQTTNAHDFAFVAITTLMASELPALVAVRAWFGVNSGRTDVAR